jgi:methyl-accepting chemotaxis protein
MKHSSFNKKLVVQTLISITVPLLLLIVFFSYQTIRMAGETRDALLKASGDDLEHTATNLYAEVQTSRNMLEENIVKVAAMADEAARKHGGLSQAVGVSEEWTAVDQITKVSKTVKLPRMMAGHIWLGHVTDVSVSVPIVDDVRQSTGDTATVFQRMDDDGDMLRVATSVVGKDGNRAVGTYIAANNSDGSANKVIATVMAGKRYVGRAFVVDRWYQTAYTPINDKNGNVIGMLYVGTPEEIATVAFRKRLLDMTVGKEGYVYIVNTKGADRGRYVLSQGGHRDGEVVLGIKDPSGRPVMKEMIEAVEKNGSGKIVTYSYDWSNNGEKPRRKIAKLVYFEPWDWMIGVSTYEEDFLGVVNKMHEDSNRAILNATLLSAAFALLACVLVGVVIRRMTKRVEILAENLRCGANETGNAAREVSHASEDLATGASEQASGIEETGATVNELTAQTHSNAENANKARGLMNEATSLAGDADKRMQALNASMAEIARVSAETQKIVKTIDDIAFQTNILALNAAVEAARAGESGAGFAVVANEVRVLAQRSAEAAKNTGNLINDSTQRINEGCETAKATAEAFAKVRERSAVVTDLVSEIAEASTDQQTGHDQIEKAINEMNTIVQRNAAAAEESAAAAEELFSQSEILLSNVNELSLLIKGGASDTNDVGTSHPGSFLASSAPQPKESRAPVARPVTTALKKKPAKSEGGFLPPVSDGGRHDDGPGSGSGGTFESQI